VASNVCQALERAHHAGTTRKDHKWYEEAGPSQSSRLFTPSAPSNIYQALPGPVALATPLVLSSSRPISTVYLPKNLNPVRHFESWSAGFRHECLLIGSNGLRCGNLDTKPDTGFNMEAERDQKRSQGRFRWAGGINGGFAVEFLIVRLEM